MSYDEQPDGDPHGECAAEIHALQKRVVELEELYKCRDGEVDALASLNQDQFLEKNK